MSLQYGDINAPASIAPLYIGAAIAYPLYGAFCCQVIWYFHKFRTDRMSLKLLVSAITLVKSLDFCLVVYQLHYYLIGRGIGLDWATFISCLHWSYIATYVTTEACCFLVEGFYLYRLLLQRKFLVVIPLTTFVIGWAFTIYMIVQTWRFPCIPEIIPQTTIGLIASYVCRIMTDGMITLSMTRMLRKSRSLASSRTNTVALLRNLVVWSVSTGALMWISSIAYVLTYVTMPENSVSLAVYFIRAGTYTNAVLAMLNHRERFRAIGNETMPMEDLSAFKSTRQDGSGIGKEYSAPE